MNHKQPQGHSRRDRCRTCAISALLLQMMVATSAFALESDKVSHYAGGAGAGLAIGTLFYHVASGMGPGQRFGTSAGLALLPGLGIEIADEFGSSHFSIGDLAADALGGITGALAAELINGQFWISASGRQIRLIGRW